MEKKKNWLVLGLALALPLLYHQLNSLFYKLVLSKSMLALMSEGMKTYIQANTFLLDTVFCILMLALYTPIYLAIHKDKAQVKEPKIVPHFGLKEFGISLVITLGIGGLSALWNMAARSLLANLSFMAESVQTFDDTFATATAPTAFIWSFLSIAIFGPIVEEVIFRGILYDGLRRFLPGIWVALLSGLYFGLWHSNPVQVVYTAIMGIIIGLAYYATGNFWFPLVIHLINNILSTLPPELETELVIIGLLVIKIVAILPMFILLHRLLKQKKAS